MATFLVVHGAWSAGWAWKKMRPLVRALGHAIFTPTCTGLGERSHLGTPEVDLADRVPERIARLVYLDAFVPEDGQAARDIVPASVPRPAIDESSWRTPPNSMPPDTGAEDLAWAVPRRVGQPRKTFAQPARLTGAVTRLPRTYIHCTRIGPGDMFGQFAARARSNPAWGFHELDASHNPHITMPETLAALLDDIARGRA